MPLVLSMLSPTSLASSATSQEGLSPLEQHVCLLFWFLLLADNRHEHVTEDGEESIQELQKYMSDNMSVEAQALRKA